MRLIRFIFIFSFLQAAIVQAQVNFPDPASDTPLSETELIAVFKGQTHRGTYSFKRINFQSYGFEETTDSEGNIKHIQDGHTETGFYNIIEDQICYNYDQNERSDFSESNPICFNIFQRGNCYYHYQRSVNNNPVSGFTARSVIKGDNPDCAPQVS